MAHMRIEGTLAFPHQIIAIAKAIVRMLDTADKTTQEYEDVSTENYAKFPDNQNLCISILADI